MKHPTLIQIQNLRNRELIFKGSGVPSGLVSLEDAIKALENLEVKLIEYYEGTNGKTELLTKNI